MSAALKDVKTRDGTVISGMELYFPKKEGDIFDIFQHIFARIEKYVYFAHVEEVVFSSNFILFRNHHHCGEKELV